MVIVLEGGVCVQTRAAALPTCVEGTVSVCVPLSPVHRQVVLIYDVTYGSRREVTDLSRGQDV